MRIIIISAFLAVLSMPIDMYGERRRRDLQARRPNVQYMYMGWTRKSTRNTMAFELYS